MSNACFLGWFGFGGMYYNAGGVGNAFGPFCPLVYKHRITGLKKKKKRRTQHFFPSCVGSSTWSRVIGQQNHLRNALQVSDMLFLVASRVDMSKKYGPMFSLLEYASDVYGSFSLSLHWRTREPSPTSGHLSLICHDFPMMASPQSKFQSMTWQRKGFCSRWIMTISITTFGMLFLQCVISYYFMRCKSRRRYIPLFPK